MQYMSQPTWRNCGSHNYVDEVQYNSLVAITPLRSLMHIAAGSLLLGHEARTGQHKTHFSSLKRAPTRSECFRNLFVQFATHSDW